MREQSKAFSWSVGIHLIALVLVLGIVRGTTPERKTLIIDFSLADQPAAAQLAQPSRGTESWTEAAKVHRPIPAKVAGQPASPVRDPVRETAPQADRVAATEDRVTVATPEPIPSSVSDSGVGARKSSVNQELAGSGSGLPGSGGGQGSTGPTSSSGQGAVAERPEVRYVKAHFAGIRSSIISKLSYPQLARRKGWAGTVKVSFVVNEDGGVNNVKVLATSGFEVLDNNAIETIRRCSPYPKPPCMAEIVMPITYRLQ
jgi:periplasmic protein TonB